MAKPSLKSGATTSSFARHSTKPGRRSTLHALALLAGPAARGGGPWRSIALSSALGSKPTARPKAAWLDSALFGRRFSRRPGRDDIRVLRQRTGGFAWRDFKAFSRRSDIHRVCGSIASLLTA